MAKPGDIVTLSFTASETIQTPTVIFKSGGDTTNDATILYTNTSNNNWISSYTVHGSDTSGNVTYAVNFKDSAGNSGTPVSVGSGTVRVDPISPTLGSFGIVSNNASGALAKPGDIVTLSFTASETIQTPSVIFKSGGQLITNAATISGPSSVGNAWTTQYTVSGGDTDGLINYSIVFKDLADNSGTTISGTGIPLVDTTLPTLSLLDISSNNASGALAKPGDIVTLSFTASETIQTPTVTFKSGGQLITNAATISGPSSVGNAWTTQYTVSGGDTDGLVNYSIVFKDLADNSGTTISGTGIPLVDTTLPTLSLLDISSNNASGALAKPGDIVTLSFTASETIQTPSVIFKSGGTLITNHSTISGPSSTGNVWTTQYTVSGGDTDGLINYSIVFKDLADNSGTTISGTGIPLVDTTLPTLSLLDISSNNASGALAKPGDIVTLSFTASETIQTPTVIFKSGGDTTNDATILYTNTSNNNWISSYTVHGSDTSGNVTYAVNFKDSAGNSGTPVSVGSGTVRVDPIPPTLGSFGIVE